VKIEKYAILIKKNINKFKLREKKRNRPNQLSVSKVDGFHFFSLRVSSCLLASVNLFIDFLLELELQ